MALDSNLSLTKTNGLPYIIVKDIYNERYENVEIFDIPFNTDHEFSGYYVIENATNEEEKKLEDLLGKDYIRNKIMQNQKFKIKEDCQYKNRVVTVEEIITPKEQNNILAEKRILQVSSRLDTFFIYQKIKI